MKNYTNPNSAGIQKDFNSMLAEELIDNTYDFKCRSAGVKRSPTTSSYHNAWSQDHKWTAKIPIWRLLRIVTVKRLVFGIKGGVKSVKRRQHGNVRIVETTQKWSIFARQKMDNHAFWSIYRNHPYDEMKCQTACLLVKFSCVNMFIST